MTAKRIGKSDTCSVIQPGQVVFSKCGRDKGRPFLVLSTDGEYIYITDGSMRPLQKPKKKKARHTQPTNTLLDLETAAGQRGLLDADIRKLLLPFTTPRDRESTERTIWND